MKEYGISEAKSKLGFQVKAVPDTAVSCVEKTVGRFATRVGVLVSAFAIVLAGFAPMNTDVAVANHDIDGPYAGKILGDTISKIKICHATGSNSNPYTMIEPNVNSFFSSGHDSDGNDIIPPFHYQVKKNDPVLAFNGMNWPSQKNIWENNCVIPGAPETATLTLVKNVVGGTATVDDFLLEADGPDHIGPAITGDTEITNAVVEVGTYTLSEDKQGLPYTASDWVCKDDGDDMEVTNGNTVVISTNQEVTCTITNTYNDPNEPLGGKITITKDVEEYQGDWSFDFTGSGSFNLNNQKTSHEFIGLYQGSYAFVESSQENWNLVDITCNEGAQYETDPNYGSLTINLGAADVSCVFTNRYDDGQTPTYSISGKVYHDNNSRNGSLDEGENGLEGWTVYIDEDGSNTLNGEELSTLSGANGDYMFSGLVAGCYTVREVLNTGWTQTEPTEVDDFEYQVAIGGASCTPAEQISLLDKIFGIKTANAAVMLDAVGLNFGNVENRRTGGGGGGGSSSSTTDEGRVLGDFTGLPYQAPQVLGEVTELPRTGMPISGILSVLAVLGIIILPKFSIAKAS